MFDFLQLPKSTALRFVLAVILAGFMAFPLTAGGLGDLKPPQAIAYSGDAQTGSGSNRDTGNNSENATFRVLKASSYEEYDQMLKSIKGKEPTLDLLSDLKYGLQHNRIWIRSAAIEAMGAFASDKFTSQKVGLLIESMMKVKDLDDIEYKIMPTASNTHFGVESDHLYSQYCVASSKMENAGREIKRRLEDMPESVERNCLLIALGLGGDMTAAREPLRKFLLSDQYGKWVMMRLQALTAFEKHGDMQDIAFLSDISKNDPYQVICFLPDFEFEQWRGTYINLTKREKENGSAEEWSKPGRPQPDPRFTRYWTRYAADKAIKAIKARMQPGK